MGKRTRVDTTIESRVLSKSLRRCCLCFQLKQEFVEKLGQIAHLDKNPRNSDESNLVYLCLEHHSLFDSQTSQHKNYTRDEVIQARERLHRHIVEITANSIERARLVTEWKQVSEQKEQIQKCIRGYMLTLNWNEMEQALQKLDILWLRSSQIIDRQFEIERALFDT